MEKSVRIVLRKPHYPVIVIDKERLHSAKNLKQLVNLLIRSKPATDEKYITILDLNCDEFWYDPENLFIAPSIIPHKWSKKKIIDLYNSQCDNPDYLYQSKSISSKLVRDIMTELCNLISKS